MKLYESGENYLKAILILEEQSGAVRSVELAAYMGYSKASISQTVSILRESGFQTKDEDGLLHLTDLGTEVARKLYEKHQFFKDQLIAAGVDPETAEKEACQMEHSISQESYEKLKEVMP